MYTIYRLPFEPNKSRTLNNKITNAQEKYRNKKNSTQTYLFYQFNWKMYMETTN